MSTQVSQTDDWIQLQINVFTRWVQNQLKNQPNIHIDSITKDLSNGVALVELAKILTHKETPRNWAEAPKRKVEMVQNCDLAVDMFWKDGVNLIGISGKDVTDNNEKLILGLVWSLILRYSIGKSVHQNSDEVKQNRIAKHNETQMLKDWAVERIENYPNINSNFTPYELSMCALLDSYVPDRINYYSLDPLDRDHNSELATNVMNDLGIPILIYPEDIKNHQSQVDDKTLLTQLSTMKYVLDEQEINNTYVSANGEKEDVESDSEFDEFSNRIVEENEMDQESQIKIDSFETTSSNERHIDINPFEQNQNNVEYHLTDNLLSEDALKVDSKEVKRNAVKGKYEKLNKTKGGSIFSFFNWLFTKVLKPVDSLIKQPPSHQRPYARVLNLNSPITPYYYYVDYYR
ncbi:ERAD pathway [Tritrichomonas musculus]|uniref:ERAD pathway n=1 Tax=Tritrichomonas musculus TaxID=1915356 RepID=A0ABR2JYE9_9EUKA